MKITRPVGATIGYDVCKAAIINQLRFRGIRTLILSGERDEESPGRAKYAIFEPDSSDRRNGKKIFAMWTASAPSEIGKKNKFGR